MLKSLVRATLLSAYLVSAPLWWTSDANAAGVTWVGTADYLQAPSAAGDEDTVGPFDTYDFGVGAAVINGAGNLNALTVGDNLTGYYQSYVTAHEYNSDGGGTVFAPNLNTTGSGGGYELTVTAAFTETITSASANSASFTLTGGTFNLMFDTTPDFNFSNDTGFSGLDTILSGTIIGGSGTLINDGSFGVTSIDIRVDSFDTNVFDPDTITLGNSVFTLQITNPTTAAFLDQITNGANSILGNSIGPNDLLVAADGNLALQAVPLPGAVWLFGSGLLGLVGISKCRKSA